MRALVIDRFGSPDVLHVAEVPVPEPGEGQVLVRVLAAGVNPIDYKMRDGSSKAVAGWTEADFPAILGRECCGVVAATGPGAGHVSPGDRVFGVNVITDPKGTAAEYALLPAGGVAQAPQGVSAAVLAGTALTGLTAWAAVHDLARVTAADTVLVHGGGGGAGQIIVQLAAATGATVYTTASARHRDRLQALGATHIDYATTDFTQAMPRPDVIIDGVYFGTFAPSLEHLAEGGRLVVLPTLADLTPARERGIDAVIASFTPDRERLAALGQMLAEGTLSVEVTAEYPLERAAEAHAVLENGHAAGKLILNVAR